MTRCARYFDALHRIIVDTGSNGIGTVLIIGPGLSDPLDDFVVRFPSAKFTLFETDHVAADKLRMRWNGSTQIANVATDPLNIGSSPSEQYDLVLTRHPNVAHFTNRWHHTLRNAANCLVHSGLMVISTYSLDEMETIETLMSEPCLELLPGAPYTTVPVDLQGNDRYIMALHRTDDAKMLPKQVG
jgi:hypothetical protein